MRKNLLRLYRYGAAATCVALLWGPVTASGAKPPVLPGHPIHNSKRKKSMFVPLIAETKGLPPNLKNEMPVWETLDVPSNAGQPAVGTRLYSSGELMSYGATRRTYHDNKIGREPAPPAWRLDARLKTEAIASLQDMLKKEFAPLPDDSPKPPYAANTHIWRAYIAEKSHTIVRVQPSQAWKDLPTVLQKIHETIQKGIVPGGVPVEQAE